MCCPLLTVMSLIHAGWGFPWWYSGWEYACQCSEYGWVHSLVWEDYTCYGATKSMCHNYWAQALEPVSHTAEPVCHNCWNPCALSPCSLAREATAMRSLCISTKSSHHSLQLENDHTKQWRPNVIKTKLINYWKKNMLNG